MNSKPFFCLALPLLSACAAAPFAATGGGLSFSAPTEFAGAGSGHEQSPRPVFVSCHAPGQGGCSSFASLGTDPVYLRGSAVRATSVGDVFGTIAEWRQEGPSGGSLLRLSRFSGSYADQVLFDHDTPGPINRPGIVHSLLTVDRNGSPEPLAAGYDFVRAFAVSDGGVQVYHGVHGISGPILSAAGEVSYGGHYAVYNSDGGSFHGTDSSMVTVDFSRPEHPIFVVIDEDVQPDLAYGFLSFVVPAQRKSNAFAASTLQIDASRRRYNVYVHGEFFGFDPSLGGGSGGPDEVAGVIRYSGVHSDVREQNTDGQNLHVVFVAD